MEDQIPPTPHSEARAKKSQMLRDAETWLGLAPDSLAKSGGSVTESDKKALDLFYVVLNALDSKAGTLMRFNGLVSGIMILLSNPALSSGLRQKWLFLLSFLAAVGAEIVCFFIFSVRYRFLRHDGNTGRELSCLAEVAEHRQRLFWWAWSFTMTATLLLVLGVVLNAIRHIWA